jgi:hypothetical protein
VVASSHQAAGNAFTEGGAVVGGLAEAGTAAGIGQAEGASADDSTAEVASDAAGLVPSLVNAPLPKRTP